VTLALPKVLLRLPYHHENNPAEGVYLDEDVAVTLYELNDDGEVVTDKAGNPIVLTAADANGVEIENTKKEVDARKMLWGNPAYILGRVITRAFEQYGWTAAIKGVDGGGLVEGLPAYTYETEEGDITLNCPTQVSITDRREKELNDLGFMAICHCKGSDKAAFFGGQTTNKARQYLTDSANANAQVSSMLPYMLASSRFAHYIKVMMRERVGSFMSKQNVSDYLNNWLSQFVLLDDGAPQALKARYPLREARVDVTEVEGKVGSFRATVFLRPHFQLEELTASIRMVADLPS
jgi:type VI secretion system protein ImpC